MESLPATLAGYAARAGAAAQNALEVARFGGLETGEEATAYDVVAVSPGFRLRHYLPPARPRKSGRSRRPPLLLVPPLMLSADVYDVAPATSAVAILHGLGMDPWVVDFGAPEREEGGLERTLTDHVLAVSDAVEEVRRASGRDVHLSGYSQGGIFCYQAAAYRRSDGIASLVTFGSPVDTLGALPPLIPGRIAEVAAGLLAGPASRRPVPAWAARTGFRLRDPVRSVRERVDFVMQLHDREALLPRERQRRFLHGEGWVAYPGPAIAELMRQFVAHNRMLSGGFVLGDRLVTLADITCPVLCFTGDVDELAPQRSVRAIRRAAPQARLYETSMACGHFGLVVGSKATEITWPTVAAWVRSRERKGEALPKRVRPLEEAVEDDGGAGAVARAAYGLELAAGFGLGAARSLSQVASQALGGTRNLLEQSPDQLRRLGRLGQMRPGSRISLGSLLDEQAHASPDEVFLLLGGRAHTRAAVKRRVDSIARGLMSIGVRRGDAVGVLMHMRPSALTAVAALNRIGAVAVLLRPDGDVAREAALGSVTRIIAEPELAATASIAAPGKVALLGGGSRPQPVEAMDLERIDPDAVAVPGWYRPNPGRAGEPAFVLFTGDGDGTRVRRITNGRWALSAFGTASSAALSSADTVYSVTPIYHPSGLLTSVGGAVAGGARLALTKRFDPATFWDEVRRYGVTIVSYTWMMLRELVEAPPQPVERHHPVRLFVGSGMPPALWRRVTLRFAPAGVLEFYAPTDGDAVLVNLSGRKPGSLGRPLPGSAPLRIAGCDPRTGELDLDADGFATACHGDATGMLLVELRHRDAAARESGVLCGVFEPDDCWSVTGDLFRRDRDGDHWLVGSVADAIPTSDGWVPPRAVQDALGELDAVEVSVAYGVEVAGQAGEVAVAAVQLRAGKQLDAARMTAALGRLEPIHRPRIVRVVERIPLTTWHRPEVASLREQGLVWARGRQAWAYDDVRDAYRPLTRAGLQRLGGPRPEPRAVAAP